MHHDAVHHLRRGKHQQTVEVEIALAAAAPPAGTLVPDGYAPVADAHQRGKMAHTLRNHPKRLLRQRLKLRIAQFFHAPRGGLPRLRRPQMLLDPRPFLFQNVQKLRLRDPPGGFQPQRQVRQELERHGFAVAPDDLHGIIPFQTHISSPKPSIPPMGKAVTIFLQWEGGRSNLIMLYFSLHLIHLPLQFRPCIIQILVCRTDSRRQRPGGISVTHHAIV